MFHEEEEEESHIRGIFGVLRPLRRSNILCERSREGRVCRAKSHNCIIVRMRACKLIARTHMYVCIFSDWRREKVYETKTWKRGAINFYYLLGICFCECAITWSANANVDFLLTPFRLFFFLSRFLSLFRFSHILSFSHSLYSSHTDKNIKAKYS